MESSPLSIRRVLILAARLVLGALMAYAGWAKLFIPFFGWKGAFLPGISPHPPVGIALALFATQIDAYQLLPPWAVTRLAHALPFVEIALGLLLLIGWRLRVWASLVSALLVGFFVIVVRTYTLGLTIPCGCFGPGGALTFLTVLRDGVLVGVSLLFTVLVFLEARSPHPWAAQEKAT
ncbi:MAG TPA: MauE/DoxX family redox-associated membrane protein [Methylomirabilota bacterium]|jgi:uncharacterized membrane protein YphA (DoxX/SURF4 family)|nr:MauE/DoxX family redox-associated membrane protein [Methylomirabilota bacterium]